MEWDPEDSELSLSLSLSKEPTIIWNCSALNWSKVNLREEKFKCYCCVLWSSNRCICFPSSNSSLLFSLSPTCMCMYVCLCVCLCHYSSRVESLFLSKHPLPSHVVRYSGFNGKTCSDSSRSNTKRLAVVVLVICIFCRTPFLLVLWRKMDKARKGLDASAILKPAQSQYSDEWNAERTWHK